MSLKDDHAEMLRRQKEQKEAGATTGAKEPKKSFSMFKSVHKPDNSIFLEMPYKEIDPAKCQRWAYHNRSDNWLSSEEQQSLAASIERDGQLELGLVREVKDNPDVFYEIIYGYRRSEACKAKGLRFKARVIPADTPDIVCLQYMHVENKESHDVSEMEDARVYRRLLADKVFKTQQELATALSLTKGRVSQLMSAAEVFEVEWLGPLLEPSITEISSRACERLSSALKDPKRARNLRNAAKRLSDDPTALAAGENVIGALLASVKPPKPKKTKEVLAKAGRRNVVSFEQDAKGRWSLSGTSGVLAEPDKEAVIERIVQKLRESL